jgi:hypothetical protein
MKKNLHHIEPRCFGGSDESSNLVSLTLREHFVAHRLLARIYPDHEKINYAYKMMSRDGEIKNGHHFSGQEQYDFYHEKAILGLRDAMNPQAAERRMFGKPSDLKPTTVKSKSKIVSPVGPLSAMQANIIDILNKVSK